MIKRQFADLVINSLPKGIKYRLNKPLLQEIKLLKQELSLKSNSYSQEGEDLVLDRIFKTNSNGFYVDVGAYDPTIYSNTFKFYERGWTGINIDARPGSMVAFEEKRPRDINLEMAVGTMEGEELKYFRFESGAYNTTSAMVAERIVREGLSKLVGQTTVKVDSLSNILSRYVPEAVSIDFMTVDVEGLDLDVLKSNDWNKFRPQILLVESFGKTILEDLDGDVYTYLRGFGYQIIAKTVNTLFLQLQ